MSASPADLGRLYTGLSEFMGPELAGALMDALPMTDQLATKSDLVTLKVEILEKLEARFDMLQARFDRLWYTLLVVLVGVIGWLVAYLT